MSGRFLALAALLLSGACASAPAADMRDEAFVAVLTVTPPEEPVGHDALDHELKEAVEGTRFGLLEMELEVRGALHEATPEPGGPQLVRFEVDANGQRIGLVAGTSDEDRARMKKLARRFEKGATVIWARGRYLPLGDSTCLLLEEFEVLEEAE